MRILSIRRESGFAILSKQKIYKAGMIDNIIIIIHFVAIFIHFSFIFCFWYLEKIPAPVLFLRIENFSNVLMGISIIISYLDIIFFNDTN